MEFDMKFMAMDSYIKRQNTNTSNFYENIIRKKRMTRAIII